MGGFTFPVISTRPLLVVMICLGAALLFVVQPLVANRLTPLFGGAPSVWLVCILFFQISLLLGYAYAHLLARLVEATWQKRIHGGLAVAGSLLLFSAGVGFEPSTSLPPSIAVLWLLSVKVGLPVVLLGGTSPLVQYWYRELSDQPYRLYAASNIASIGALVAYPFLIEPLSDLDVQLVSWHWGFVAYAAVIVSLAITHRQHDPDDREPESTVPHASWVWFLMSALGAVFLLSLSNIITRQVAPFPLLWVLPLVLYLLTFVFCFDHDRWYRPLLFIPLATCLALGAFLHLYDDTLIAGAWLLVIHCGLLFCICMICHGELALRRPPAVDLTWFYLCVAAGGVGGSLFVSVIAPLVFDFYAELPLAIGVLAGFVVWSYLSSKRFAGIAFGVVLTLTVAVEVNERQGQVSAARTFYAHYQVHEGETSAGNPYRKLKSDDIVHGSQLQESRQRVVPTTYYSAESGVGVVLNRFDYRRRKVGTIGLGAGTIAVYGKTGDDFVFYEIDPEVENIARRDFSFLSGSPARIRVVQGDARLSLERELETGTRRFHILILDAFSGDAVPFHLLTREAWELYWKLLHPKGALLLHISNSYLDFLPVVRGHNREERRPMILLASRYRTGLDVYVSRWVLVTENEDLLDVDWIRKRGRPIDPDGPTLDWTDQRHSVVPLLLEN